MFKTLRDRIWFARYCIVHRRSLSAQRRWQESYLRRMVQHAYARVPLWRTLLDDAGVAPGSVHTLADLPRLPVTCKETFVGKVVEEYIDSTRPSQSPWYVTSGTGGMPFRFLMSEHAASDQYANFGSLRFLWWRGVRALGDVRVARIKIRGPERDARLFVPVEEFLSDERSALARIAAFKPDVLSTYPSLLLEIAREVQRDDTLLRPRPPYILSFGEMLTPAARSHVQQVLGAEVYDRYGLEEIGAIGVECSMHDGFHINVESVVVEITDDEYRPLSEGQEGRILATDLFNFSMPFIRYDTGDRGRLSSEPCACGVRAPRLWIEGRYSAYLTFGSRKIHHLEVDGAMDGFMNEILLYQIAKRSDTEALARIIPGPAYSAHTDVEIVARLQALLGPSVRVTVQLVEKLPITPRGKSRIVLDETVGSGKETIDTSENTSYTEDR